MRRITVKDLIAERQRRNRAFARLSPARKRVTVAKDVLKMLGDGKIKATSGTYWAPVKPIPLSEVKDGAEFSDVLSTIPQCNACAIGSLFMAGVYRADKVKIATTKDGDVDCDNTNTIVCGGSDMGGTWFSADERGYLEDMKLFTSRQLALMENAFEQTHITGLAGNSAKDLTLDDVGSDRERLRLIMENVVRNKGTFRPRDRKMRKEAAKL